MGAQAREREKVIRAIECLSKDKTLETHKFGSIR